ncbi:MAG: tetratricopeptide repeat protein [Spirochaetales bacterium]|nr:tetratricopeptide repeat protein [Spirochaetales bacterium]
MNRVSRISTIILGIALITACTTTGTEIEDNLSPGEFFQRAQSASVEFSDYQKAMLYYKTFIERYPSEQILIMEAEYEIAFLYYKMGDFATSSELFTKIIDRYKQPEAAILPSWPEVLSKKILGIIQEAEKASIETE